MTPRDWSLSLIALVALGATHCSAPAAASDETHFLCSADVECKRLGADRICELGQCVVAPDGYPTLGDGGIALSLPMSDDPGPAADCTQNLPDDAASFETTARRLPPTALDPSWPPLGQEPVLSASGSAIVFGAGTHEVASSQTDVVQGHLVRWVGDSLTWLGQPEQGVVFPRAVSCDGSNILGRPSDLSTSHRWSRERGYESTPGFPDAIAPTGDALFGFDGTTAVKWPDGAAPEVLFELPLGTNGLDLSQGGDAFLYDVGDQHFVRVGDAEPIQITLSLDQTCGLLTFYKVSTGGRVVTGTATCPPDGLRSFVWTEAGGTQVLPDSTFIRAVTPGVVAVGEFRQVTPPLPNDGPYRGIVWDPRHGLRFLDELLAEHGVTLPLGVSITTVTDASDDGRVFTGTCVDQREPGRKNVFRAVLPAGAFD